MDGDGALELFVGGRVIPGRYPAPAGSRLFRRDPASGQFTAPDDANNLVLYLLEGTDFATGAIYTIDGGRMLG